jgi:hypothetical protein
VVYTRDGAAKVRLIPGLASGWVALLVGVTLARCPARITRNKMANKSAATAAADAYLQVVIDQQRLTREKDELLRKAQQAQQQLAELIGLGAWAKHYTSLHNALPQVGIVGSDIAEWRKLLNNLPSSLQAQHEAVIPQIADALKSVAASYREIGIAQRWVDADHEAYYTRRWANASDGAARLKYNMATDILGPMMTTGEVNDDVLRDTLASALGNAALGRVAEIADDVLMNRLGPPESVSIAVPEWLRESDEQTTAKQTAPSEEWSKPLSQNEWKTVFDVESRATAVKRLKAMGHAVQKEPHGWGRCQVNLIAHPELRGPINAVLEQRPTKKARRGRCAKSNL